VVKPAVGTDLCARTKRIRDDDIDEDTGGSDDTGEGNEQNSDSG